MLKLKEMPSDRMLIEKTDLLFYIIKQIEQHRKKN